MLQEIKNQVATLLARTKGELGVEKDYARGGEHALESVLGMLEDMEPTPKTSGKVGILKVRYVAEEGQTWVWEVIAPCVREMGQFLPQKLP